MKLMKGKKAATPKGMRHNVKTMEKADKKLVKKMVKPSALKKGKK
jgi:hypothetical protein